MVNHMVLQGRLTRDPELRTTQSGTSVCSFTVAWSEKYKETETQLFMDCSAWRGTGEMVSKYFTKGKEILVEGKLRTDKWKDKDGNDRTSIKMTVERVHFCGPKDGSTPAASAPVPSDGHSDFAEVEDDGELPF
jgi:single-strand DNA-binding protein